MTAIFGMTNFILKLYSGHMMENKEKFAAREQKSLL
jgi:hypothetical protein